MCDDEIVCGIFRKISEGEGLSKAQKCTLAVRTLGKSFSWIRSDPEELVPEGAQEQMVPTLGGCSGKWGAKSKILPRPKCWKLNFDPGKCWSVGFGEGGKG